MSGKKVSAARCYSPKQIFVFRWWSTPALRDNDGIICDGAVRSGPQDIVLFHAVTVSL